MSVSTTVVSTRNCLPSSRPSCTAAWTTAWLMACMVAGVRRLKAVVLRHAMAVEVGKAAQGKAVVNAFAQLAIIPVFDAHQDEGAQGLRGSDATASGVGVLQAARQILAHLLDQRGMVVQEPGDAL